MKFRQITKAWYKNLVQNKSPSNKIWHKLKNRQISYKTNPLNKKQKIKAEV